MAGFITGADRFAALNRNSTFPYNGNGISIQPGSANAGSNINSLLGAGINNRNNIANPYLGLAGVGLGGFGAGSAWASLAASIGFLVTTMIQNSVVNRDGGAANNTVEHDAAGGCASCQNHNASGPNWNEGINMSFDH